MWKSLFKNIALALNILFAAVTVFFVGTSYRPKNILEFCMLFFFLIVPIFSIYEIWFKGNKHKIKFLESSSEAYLSLNPIKSIAILLNVSMLFLIVMTLEKSPHLYIFLSFTLLPSIIALLVMLFDENWQWIGLYSTRNTLNERRTHSYNKFAVISFIISLLSVTGFSLINERLALVSGAISSILGFVALIQIGNSKERGSALALAAITTRELFKLILVM